MVAACQCILKARTLWSLTSSMGGISEAQGHMNGASLETAFEFRFSSFLNDSHSFQILMQRGCNLTFWPCTLSPVKPLGSCSRWSPLLLPLWCILPVCLVLSSSPALLPCTPSTQPTIPLMHTAASLSPEYRKEWPIGPLLRDVVNENFWQYSIHFASWVQWYVFPSVFILQQFKTEHSTSFPCRQQSDKMDEE